MTNTSAPAPGLSFPEKIEVWPRDEQSRRPDAVAYVLGFAAQPWVLTNIARVLQEEDPSIPKKTEAELSAALHFLVVHALKDPENGLDNANAELKAMRAAQIEKVAAQIEKMPDPAEKVAPSADIVAPEPEA